MRILLVDLWNVFHIYWHAGVNKEAGWAFKETMGRCRALARDFDYCAFMADGGNSFRKELDQRWKANRAEKAAGLFAQLAETERQLDVESFHVFKVERFEADDLIASAVKQLRQATWGADAPIITINSADRDLFTLLEPGVEIMWSMAPHKIVQAEHLRQSDKIGVDPSKMRDFLVLSDSHNGVKYFQSIGPKHAARLLNQFGDLAGIMKALDNRVPDCDQFEVGPPSIRESLKKALAETIDGRPLLDVAVQIVTLRTDAPIDVMTIFQNRAPRAAPVEWDDGQSDNAPPSQSRWTSGDHDRNRSEPVRSGEIYDTSGTVSRNGGESVRGAGPSIADGESVRGTRTVPEISNERADASSDGLGSASGIRPRTLGAEFSVVAQPVGGDQGPGVVSGTRQEVSSTDTTKGQVVDRAPLALPPRWELSLEPSSPAQAWSLAKLADQAKFWQRHGGPAGCMMIIMAGRSRGLTAFDALNGMHIIEGKPVFGAYLLIGMVQREKRCAYFELVESDEKHAKWITKRKGSKVEQARVYSIENAAKAGLVRDKSNWDRHPEDMLIKTAGAKLTRAAWADVTSGAVAAEEMGYE